VSYVQKRRYANWIGLLLRRNRLLKYVIEGKVGVKGKRERSHKQLLEDREERIGYWKFQEEELDRFFWRTRFGRAMDLYD
jgi:TolB-like protein